MMSYTYSRVFKKTEGINQGRRYPAYYDRPHTADMSIAADLNRWQLSVNWTFSSGMRFSSPVGFYYYHGIQLPIYGEKNNDQLPNYHRMDVSASFRINKNIKKRFRHELLISVFNLYGRENYLSINFNKTESSAGDIYVPSDYISESELMPTAATGLGFVPSLSYRVVFK